MLSFLVLVDCCCANKSVHVFTGKYKGIDPAPCWSLSFRHAYGRCIASLEASSYYFPSQPYPHNLELLHNASIQIPCGCVVHQPWANEDVLPSCLELHLVVCQHFCQFWKIFYSWHDVMFNKFLGVKAGKYDTKEFKLHGISYVNIFKLNLTFSSFSILLISYLTKSLIRKANQWETQNMWRAKACDVVMWSGCSLWGG